jgi:DNA gyrase subunit A
MDAFTNVPSNGKIAMKFEGEDEDDRLIGVALLEENDDVLLATRQGKAIRFAGDDVREFQSRNSTGVRGMRLAKGDEVISLTILHRVGTRQEERDDYLRFAPWKPDKDGSFAMSDERFGQLMEQEQFILTVASNGMGKISSAYDYRRTGRGGQGIANIDLKRDAHVVASFPAAHGDQLMLVTNQAKLIRMKIELRHLLDHEGGLRVLSRGSAGVKLFDVADDEYVVSAAKIEESGEEDAGETTDGGENEA